MHETFQKMLTEIAIKWNAGQKMALFMVLMASEVCNYLGWMVFINLSDTAKNFVNINLINTLLPMVGLSLILITVSGILFFIENKNQKFIDKLEILTMLIYSIGAASAGYLIGHDNIISGISITTGCILIGILCQKKYAFYFISLNIIMMFGFMLISNVHYFKPPTLHIGSSLSPFWVYSYLQLCAIKLIGVLYFVYSFKLVLQDVYTNTKYISEHDGLTGLPNRKQVMNYLEYCLTKNEPVGLVMIDLDHFKQVNDNFGHSKGDEVLVKVSAVLKQSLREYDLLGRYGGEEFILVIPNANMEIATIVSSRLHQMVRQLEIPLDKNKILRPTASFGVVSTEFITELYGDNLSDFDIQQHLFEIADASMYYAKAHGRNLLVTALDLPKESLSTQNQETVKKEINLNIIEIS